VLPEAEDVQHRQRRRGADAVAFGQVAARAPLRRLGEQAEREQPEHAARDDDQGLAPNLPCRRAEQGPERRQPARPGRGVDVESVRSGQALDKFGDLPGGREPVDDDLDGSGA
jgi:hypothetical protein